MKAAIAKLISSHIGGEGEVVALTEKGCYVHKRTMTKPQAKDMLKRLADADEINTEHWDLEWKKETYGS